MACMLFLSKGDASPALRGQMGGHAFPSSSEIHDVQNGFEIVLVNSGGPAAEAVCTGDGKIKGNGPACYANSLASNSFSVKVISILAN